MRSQHDSRLRQNNVAACCRGPVRNSPVIRAFSPQSGVVHGPSLTVRGLQTVQFTSQFLRQCSVYTTERPNRKTSAHDSVQAGQPHNSRPPVETIILLEYRSIARLTMTNFAQSTTFSYVSLWRTRSRTEPLNSVNRVRNTDFATFALQMNAHTAAQSDFLQPIKSRVSRGRLSAPDASAEVALSGSG